MISHYHLVRSFQRERQRIQITELQTEFIRGMMTGLTLAVSMANDLWQKTKNEPHPNPMGSRRTFFRAICLAHDTLKRGERSKGIAILAKVIDRAKEKEHG